MSVAKAYRLKASPWSSHGRILRYLEGRPRTARILDVGTADGYLGRALRDAGFTHIVGLEQDAVLAAGARGRSVYAEVIECDLDQPATWPPAAPFDVIICADVLEHVRDPWSALRELVNRLTAQGRVVISMPNSGHWWVRLNVLCGRFPLEARGLFDRTHLHFFTWAGLRDLVSGAGLSVEHCWVTPIPFTSLGDGSAANRLARGGEAVYRGLALAWKRLFAYQFVLVARRHAGVAQR